MSGIKQMNYRKAGNKNKNRILLGLALILALIFTGGSYASTWYTAGATIGVAEPTGDAASCNASSTQPDWDSVLTPVADTIIFRPDAAGDETGIDLQYPATGEHWDKVDEETSDDDSTYVSSNSTAWQKDLYSVNDHSTQTAGGTINYVRVYAVFRAETGNITQASACVLLKTNGVSDNATEVTVTTSYAEYSSQWDLNPQTSLAWTWDEIDALQIGVGLRSANGAEVYTRCSQVYVQVGFAAPPLTGNTPTGDLFVVYPNADYPGDMAVKVYLANTGNLTKAYDYLNMHLYLEGSVEAGQTPNYRVLSLQSGSATFKLEDGGSDNHTLSIIGGDYGLNSREPSEWYAGWTVTPELFCEVTQR
jgi:hypothetical protein